MSTILFTAALLSLCAATPLQSRYVVKETHRVPHEFSREGNAPSQALIRLSVGLKQGRFHELEKQLYEISDPDHSHYGQYLSLDEVNELVKPKDESLELVQEWLHQHVDPKNINYSPARDFLTFILPVAKVERLLETKYSVYRHVDGSTIIRTPEWKLPLHLHDHVTAIQPTTSFIRAVPQSKTYLNVPGTVGHPLPYGPSNGTVDQVCNTRAVTPLCLRTLYGTVDYKPKVPGQNQVALTDYLGELNNRSDTEIYLQRYRPEAVSAAYKFRQISIANGTLQQTPNSPAQLRAGTGIEGNLDAETILGISWPTPLLAWSTAGDPPFAPDIDNPTVDNEPYLTWVNYVLKQDFVPQVISNSYEDNEQTVPYSYANVVCSQFAQLSARGVSILFGSGDGGVGGVQPGGSCLSNVNNQTQFIPLFPSSCPYVTSVGATVNFKPEVAAYDPRNKFSSGGGFSNYFPQPKYQAEAVSEYLDTIGEEFSPLYNKSGRAYPDLAAYGVNYTIIWNGTLRLVDGTSASTPAMAAIFALLNDALISNGKPPLGFLNPWLYKKGKKAFVDVTSGSALGCNTTGFPATKGWDAVTGFGTPVSPAN
ncbi:subtilisin-like protein [Lindgomyces ingoldianus]|uniref:Subtilisin-like protein n=1 Tax=Lindgomyces ingoldianus TaxID=673940 RepID=A0ACB6QLC4_9PLEO|nr:subtilisin-like protein [Lindgomyces ingoldianus]KAF2466926.1 subtilisin-like protein [Lindgomyces ingoldianus]